MAVTGMHSCEHYSACNVSMSAGLLMLEQLAAAAVDRRSDLPGL